MADVKAKTPTPGPTLVIPLVGLLVLYLTGWGDFSAHLFWQLPVTTIAIGIASALLALVFVGLVAVVKDREKRP